MTQPDSAPEHDPGRCHACRGTGRVLSNKGEHPHEIPCPWCEGTGRFVPEHDAQEARREERGSLPRG